MGEEVFDHLVGSSDFGFNLKFDKNPKQRLAWGHAELWANQNLVWAQQDDEDASPKPVHWTWVDLLEFLGTNWKFLAYEESYPSFLALSPPLYPNRVRHSAERRWESLTEAQIQDEDEVLFRFERRHDLASGLKGIFLPSVTLMREGAMMWVCTSDYCRQYPFRHVIEVLETVGGYIADQLKESKEPRASRALKRWNSRAEIPLDKLVVIRAGLPSDHFSELTNGSIISEYWDIEAANDDSELLAAARLSVGAVDIAEQRKVIEKVRAQPPVKTPELDALSAEFQETMVSLTSERPYLQGYKAANWMRQRLGIRTVFDPESALQSWGVIITTIVVEGSPIEAVACWGSKHGPAILLNVAESSISSRVSGRRSTLAHEIAHLLLDRQGSLPLAEALGGNTPEWVEKRARAFAAELLLPRSLAADAVTDAMAAEEGMDDKSAIDRAIQHLSEAFNVSAAIATHQLWNSGVSTTLSSAAHSHLELLHRRVSHASLRIVN